MCSSITQKQKTGLAYTTPAVAGMNTQIHFLESPSGVSLPRLGSRSVTQKTPRITNLAFLESCFLERSFDFSQMKTRRSNRMTSSYPRSVHTRGWSSKVMVRWASGRPVRATNSTSMAISTFLEISIRVALCLALPGRRSEATCISAPATWASG